MICLVWLVLVGNILLIIPILLSFFVIKLNMSKRNGIATTLCDSKKPRPWTLSLLDTMKDPDSIVKKSENVVVIKDKFPKAKLHYLILPQEDISSITKLSSSHLPLLNEFKTLFEEVRIENPNLQLRAGFHAVPSMYRLHMHIISTDMISPCLKTKVHWNSFTTAFFIPLEEITKELKLNNCIKKISSEAHKSLMNTALKCNQCSFVPKNMPDLKKHLLSHTS